MGVVRISQFQDALVLHFQTDDNRINAYTLASTLVAIADAAKAANDSVNVGYNIEILVEAIGPGSFRAKIRTVYATAKNLFSSEPAKQILLAILAAFIYERTLSVDHSVKVSVSSDEVVIVSGDDRIVVPRNVYDAARDAEKNPDFRRAIDRTLESIRDDDHIEGFGFVKDMDSPRPKVLISKKQLAQVAILGVDDPQVRILIEHCSLQIVKAVLEKGRRKWEFNWRGVRISAPILDEIFFADFRDHRITIAPGDELEVRLALRQSLDPISGVYTNIGYEVIEVLKHIPRVRQTPLNQDEGKK